MKMEEEKYEGITGKKSSSMAIIFFTLGLIGALGFRAVLLLNKIDYLYASIAWYIAIISHLFFYSYRMYIEKRRREIILRNRLREKIETNNLNNEDKKKIKTILDSILVSKFNLNLVILVILTALALIIQIIIDFIWII